MLKWKKHKMRIKKTLIGDEERLGLSYVFKSLRVLPRITVDPYGKTGPQMGVNWMGWSGDGQLLAVRAENFPKCIWIWNTLDGKLSALLIQLSAVTSTAWRPWNPARPHLKPMLAFCTGFPRVYVWTPDGPSWIDIPVPPVRNETAVDKAAAGPVSGFGTDGRMLVQIIRWSSDGSRLMMIGKNAFSICDVDSLLSS